VSEFISATAPAGVARRLALAAFALVLGSLLATGSANAAEPAHNTTTTVACPQTQVFPTEVSNCTITVTDVAATGATAPTGAIHLALAPPLPFLDAEGVVRPGTCTLAPVSANSSSCAAFWTPVGSDNSFAKVAGIYTGDATHATSRGESALLEGLLRHESVTKVTCSTSQPALGETVPCQVSVRTKDTLPTSTAPTGSVDLSYGDLDQSGPSPSPSTCTLVVSGSEGRCSTTVHVTRPGTQILHAFYDRDANHEFSSVNFEFHVAETGKQATALSTTCPKTSQPGETVLCMFRLKSLSPNPVQPTGTITFVTSGQGRFGTSTTGQCKLLPFTQSEAFCTTNFTMPSSESIGVVGGRFAGNGSLTKAFSDASIENHFPFPGA
jgi:hypothetical protein